MQSSFYRKGHAARRNRRPLLRASAAALAAVLTLSLSFPALAADKLEKVSGGTYLLFDGSSKISGVLHRGVDVSHWQGEIDWKKAAADDVSFVMLGTRYQGAVDPLFQQNAEDAAAAGVKIGVYIYSYATTVEMAEKEADFVLDLIKDYPISYPVAFDAENPDTLGALPQDEITKIVRAFCNKIRDAGYCPILYANDAWLNSKLDMSALSDLPVWGAAFERTLKWDAPYIWQASESGSVEGIPDGVDIDLQFKEFNIPADSWKKFDGVWYYYENYRRVSDKLINDGSNSYYMKSDGTIFTGGWKTLDGKKCYFDPASGIMRRGWKKIESSWYYFGQDGDLQTGWINDNGTWYFTAADGIMQTGWLKSGASWFFLNGSGAMQTGVIEQNGVHYYLGADGAMYHDTTVEYDGRKWDIDGSGAMKEHSEEAAADVSGAAGTAAGTESAAITGGSSGTAPDTGASRTSGSAGTASGTVTPVEALPGSSEPSGAGAAGIPDAIESGASAGTQGASGADTSSGPQGTSSGGTGKVMPSGT